MRITIILVAPARAENIGAAARAMKTMGFSELRIVDSQAHLEPATRWVAHGSGDIIDNIASNKYKATKPLNIPYNNPPVLFIILNIGKFAINSAIPFINANINLDIPNKNIQDRTLDRMQYWEVKKIQT